jgi:hypothetical protein
MGATPDLFVYVVYAAPIGSKHESKSLFQNMVANIIKIHILGGIRFLGGDFNVRIATLLNTIDTNAICELLHAPKIIET